MGSAVRITIGNLPFDLSVNNHLTSVSPLCRPSLLN